MKAIVKAFSIVLFTTAFITIQAFAGGDPMVEKKKTYSKSYAVNNSDKINLDNRFGELKITTWDKNEVKVDVTITAKANTDQRAQEILDLISIEDSKSGSGVYFKTKLADQKKDWEKRDKKEYRDENFSINYSVSMPAQNPLDATNQFGAMIVPDLNGPVELESKFGSLTAGKLANSKRVDVEFGKATIESITGGILEIKFARGLVNKLNGEVDARFEYSGVKLVVDNSIKGLKIKNSFTELNLDLNKGLSASFDIHTSFCDIDNKTAFDIKKENDDDDRHGPKFDHDYSGKAGNGGTAIKINSSFGEVKLGHDISFDVNKEDKSEKKKVRAV